MTRILHIVNSMNRGGLETTIINILRNINKEKVVFDFLLHTNEKCEYNDEILALGGKIYYITPRRESFLKNKKELKDFFKEHKEYNTVHMHVSSLSYIMPLKIAKKYGVSRRIIHSRSSMSGGSKINKYIHKFNKLYIQSIATDFFSCSDLAGKWLYTKKIRNSKKYKIIKNGIETEKFIYSMEERLKTREKLKLKDELVLVNVGRLYEVKNHMFLIDVFYQLNIMQPNSKLFIIGEGPLRKQIEQKIKNMNLEGKVILLGKRTDINDLLQGMDIFVMPSLYEGLPGSVIEAQGAGLPCIISDVITKEVNITNLVTYISLKELPEFWAEKILQIYNQTKRKNMQHEIIEAGFDMKDIAKELEKIYITKDEK